MKYTEEEKKAVEDFKEDTRMAKIYKFQKRYEINSKILNLIDKQQKEIERLSFDNKILDCQLDSNGKNIDMLKNEILNNMISKEAIRKKIEEYKHKDFIKMQVVMRHDKEALKIVKILEELLGDE